MSFRTDKTVSIDTLIKKFLYLIESNTNRLLGGYRMPFSERRAFLFVIDSILIFTAIWCAFVLWGWSDTGQFQLVNERMSGSFYWYPMLFGGWMVLAWLNDLYDVPSSYDSGLSALRIGIVATIGLCIYLFIYFLSPAEMLPRTFVVNFLAISSAAVMTWRAGYIQLSNTLPFTHRVLIVGGGERAHIIADAVEQTSGLRYEIVGFVNDSSEFASEKQVENAVGIADHLVALSQRMDVHEVIVAIDRSLDRGLFNILADCQANGIRVSWMPDLYEKLLRKIPVQHIDPAWALQAMQDKAVFSRFQLALKRILDLVIVLAVTPTFMLLIPLIALAIKLDSAGPVFYRQTRSGRAGKHFSIYKFRTMATDAEKDGKPQWAMVNDMRITKVGMILRKSRLDELPQIFNILKGEMSLVGPRPERPEFVEELEKQIPYYRTRLMVKPGLTGWAQVHYDYGNTIEDAVYKLQYDFYYVRYWSIWMDIYTMFQTFAVVFKLKGM